MKSKAIGALALLLTASMPAMALEGADVYSQVRSSLVQLVGVGVEGRFYLGSGVALPNGSIVTNCHVTQHAKRLEPFWGNTSTRAESQRADVQHDLCLVQMPGLQVRPTEVASSKGLHVGDKVYAVGFNGGRRLTYEEGEVSELFPLDGGMVIRTTAAFSQGASGGGLFDAEGRLVGILTFFRVSGEICVLRGAGRVDQERRRRHERRGPTDGRHAVLGSEPGTAAAVPASRRAGSRRTLAGAGAARARLDRVESAGRECMGYTRARLGEDGRSGHRGYRLQTRRRNPQRTP